MIGNATIRKATLGRWMQLGAVTARLPDSSRQDVPQVTTLSVVTLAFAMLASPLPASGEEDGKLMFNNACRTCHSTDAGDNRLGPNLHAIVGRKAAAAEGYAYSSALSRSHFTWTAEKIDAFIANPNAVVPGNNMKPYAGIQDAEQRRKIIDHLRASDGN